MSLSKWKELAAEKTKTGKMKQNLFDEITAQKIRSKTTDEAMAKTFRLDRLDQIAEQTEPKAKRQVRFQIPRINRDGDIDYAPEVDPYEDMDVEGLLNLEDYVAPGAEKQIAKMPKEAPKYEMDPSVWQIPSEPGLPEPPGPPGLPEEPLGIKAPEEREAEDTSYLQLPEEEEEVTEARTREANKILDQLELPNYDDVEMRLAEREMTATKQRSYLNYVIKNADTRRRQTVAMKSNATKSFNKGKITKEERDLIHNKSNQLQEEIKDYIKYYKSKIKTIKGSVRQIGRGAYFFTNAKEMLQTLTLVIAEMEAGNTSLQMRNMGQSILNALLHSKYINKGQYQKLVKKYFSL